VEYFTRFTDEIFSLLISVIFIIEALKDLTGLYTNPAVPFVKAMFSSVVAGLVFGIARQLKGFRRTPYLNKPIRETVADFAPTLGIATGTACWAYPFYCALPVTVSLAANCNALLLTTTRPLLQEFGCPLRLLPGLESHFLPCQCRPPSAPP
jgi:hypothetical protein